MHDNFDNIRCYTDREAVEALRRMVGYDEFYPLFRHVFPDLSKAGLTDLFLSITGSYDFQKRVVDKAVKTVVNLSMDEFSWGGIENIEKDGAYLYVANHRDIVLDAALLQHVLVSNSMNTTQITFGSNLMTTPFIIDFGKTNKMFTVFRNPDSREQIRISKQLSEYMRYVIEVKKESLWIAQRSGRTKDGIDITQQGLLRMFSMSGSGSIKKRLKELNIVPLSISYEYEPCDYLKVSETFHSKQGKYIKKPGEDYRSIAEGITGYKGRTKLVLGKPLTDFIDALPDSMDKKDLFKVVAAEIDRQIYENYKLWPSNYIAADLLNGNRQYSSQYNNSEKERFLENMNKKMTLVDLKETDFKNQFLQLYANPVRFVSK
ncbi:MAG TPA: 1-acyl-sn-glycerol-3-phosphate acyltransferase [Draconibacterium sp.]|nr:1-acyl-sn-glycerol-3-phosphate acyltransferase [Draconibacterium sp.]